MSKVTMPEPVAWLIYSPAANHKHATTENVETKRLSDGSVVYTSSPLVMASEMEAYAAAKVREALEEAEEAVTTLYESEELPLLPDIAKAINACMTRGK